MSFRIIMFASLLLAFAGCNPSTKQAVADHDHEHGTELNGHSATDEEHPKIQYTAYSAEFEVFAEADAFVAGEAANVLSHFSHLPDFNALESGQVTLVLTVDGKENRQTLDAPVRKGIYSFDITPEVAGNGTLKFEIVTAQGISAIVVPDVTIFAEHHDAHHAAEEMEQPSKVNTTVFTKEQSWKTEFATGLPVRKPMGQIIKTTAKVLPAPGDEVLVTAKTNGTIHLGKAGLTEGAAVSGGQALFAISGSGFSDRDMKVRYSEAKMNFDKAEADYQRAKELAVDKIVSDKELMAVKANYENSKSVFDNLQSNFTPSGQTVTSPIGGFVKQLLVENGQYVEAGTSLALISQNKTLQLYAEVEQRYQPLLGNILSANIKSINDKAVYPLDALNGKVISYGRSAGSDDYLIPVNLQVDNRGGLLQGGFVELYLKAGSAEPVITIPNSALLEEQGNYFVYVQINPELFEKREVKPGVTDGLDTAILSGLSETERVVTQGAILIKLAQATGALDPHSGHVH